MIISRNRNIFIAGGDARGPYAGEDARGPFCESVAEKLCHEGDGNHGEEGADEGDLGDERGIAVVSQTEDGAVGRNGHGDDERVDVDDIRGEAYGAEDDVEQQREDEQPEVTYTTREPSIVRQERRDIDEPMMSKAPGTVMLPIMVMG